jgi:hypothetical protein
MNLGSLDTPGTEAEAAAAAAEGTCFTALSSALEADRNSSLAAASTSCSAAS